MFSMKTIYALRSAQYLAEKYNKGNVLIGEISENEKIPKKFLENILLILKKEGFLISKTGKGGGYSLMTSPEQISLADVIISLEEYCADPLRRRLRRRIQMRTLRRSQHMRDIYCYAGCV